MDKIKRWKMSYDNKTSPCVITDRETVEILYCNPAFLKVFDLKENVQGKFFYDILPVSHSHFEDEMPDWNSQDFYETESYNRKFNRQFHLQAFIDRSDDSIYCEMIPLEDNLEQNFQFEEAMTRCMEIYAQPAEAVLISFMELLCEFYRSERAYVYRFNLEKNAISCVSQWCVDPHFIVTEEVSTKMDGSFLLKWLDSEKDAGIVFADGENPDFDQNPTLGEILTTFKMKNLVLCPIEDGNHNLIAVVGLSNRKDFREFFDRRLITTIARFVAQDVAKGAVDTSLFQLHNRDSLTGLYNRNGYAKRMEQIKEENPKSLGVISMNINGLKFINDNVGIAEGDKQIKKSAKRLKDHFNFEIFRMSGDEFLGIAPNVEEADFDNSVKSLYQKMRQEGNYDFSLGFSWGSGALDYSKQILEAETIMYINKQEYYSSSGRTILSVSNAILRDLLAYLENDEFLIYLQPQVRLEDGSLHGAEALVRRFDKLNQKMVFPDQFIPIYEQSSVIRYVDLFVLEAVCKLLQQWSESGKAIPIAVNFSRVTLQEYGIVEICDRYQVPHSFVVIEVTERVGLIENNVASSLVNEFIKEGFTISLDDFGSAYSNIITLAQIDVDEVKIDKSLVDNLTENRKNHILVKNVLTMCKELEGMSTLAEGIEDETQSTLLHELGCHLGQGYYYSRPIPVDEFTKMYIAQ